MTPVMSNRHLLVGVCGFAESQERVFRDFQILEVQQTFYQPPLISTAERWRARAPKDFVFTLKAWQLLTHVASSPTYRRLRERLSANDLTRAGDFKWNPVTRMAWGRTQEIADALNAEAIVFQAPKAFLPTKQNIARLQYFFDGVDRKGRRLIFEPRGEAWSSETTRPLIRDLDLVHGVDPFIRKPVGRGLRYFRLHGRPAYHYHYEYTDDDLGCLEAMLSGGWPNRVLFNNDAMAGDARRFLQRVETDTN